MRGLFRSAVALFALGIGCNKSGDTTPPENAPKNVESGWSRSAIPVFLSNMLI